MTGELPYPGPWCSECGYPGVELTASIDPGHPLGYCRRGAPKAAGCGRVILTRSRSEADAAYDRRRRRYTTARHRSHDTDKAPQAYCDLCPPPIRSTAPVNPGIESADVWSADVHTGRRP